jgi:YfiH family protein
MISVIIKGMPVLQFTGLNSFPGLFHFSSLRVGGTSKDNYSSLNLGLNSGDAPHNVLANRMKLCDALDIDSAKFVLPKQTHSATVKVIDPDFFRFDEHERKAFLNETDAVITNIEGVCVAIKTADCIPVLLFDPKRKVVAAIHAGWRGTIQNIVLKTIIKLTEEFGSQPADLFAGIGPSISPGVYEVGKEVWGQFAAEFYSDTAPAQEDKKVLNLWKANHAQLIFAGVPSNQIETARICTLSDRERFFSARRDGPKTGRMATGIMMRE